jgi:hypothetical protein
MTVDVQTNIPPPQVPPLTPGGTFNEVWWEFLMKLFTRTGGTGGQGLAGPPGPGNVLSIGAVTSGSAPAVAIHGASPSQVLDFVLQPGPTGPPGPSSNVTPAAPVTVTASPFVYTAALRGVLFISGGGIKNLEFSRDSGVTWYPTGSFYGCFFVAAADQLRVTYATAPSIVFASN